MEGNRQRPQRKNSQTSSLDNGILSSSPKVKEGAYLEEGCVKYTFWCLAHWGFHITGARTHCALLGGDQCKQCEKAPDEFKRFVEMRFVQKHR
jgi:hypothetical protein